MSVKTTLKDLPPASGKHLTEDVKCPICKDGGWVYRAGNLCPVPCDCQKPELEAHRREALIKRCGLPAGAEGYRFSTFYKGKRPGEYISLECAYQLSRDLSEEKGNVKWLTLMAPVDRGKTHLAIAICRRWLERGRPARYVYVPLLLEELREGFSRTGDQSYQILFDFYLNVDLLVLDDLGTESQTPWVMEKLDTIVDYRAVNQLPLVVTTNKAMDELPVRIASRLQRVPFGKVVVISSPEYRTWGNKDK